MFEINATNNALQTVLICATPAPGHVNPMLAVARHLNGIGYQVIFNTGDVFRDQIESVGIRFVPLEGAADFDYRRLDDAFPERKKFEPGPAQLAHDFKHGFGQPIPDQYRVIRKIMNHTDIDLVLADMMFMGTFPLLLALDSQRPPVIACGVTPMLVSSMDVSPFTAPEPGVQNRERIRQDNQQFQSMFQPVQEYINQILQECGAAPMPGFFLDCMYTLPDHFLQFTAEAFEYPRSDMPFNVRFVGPMLPAPSGHSKKPDWWAELDGSKPVVLVTQGTIANEDPSQLIEPALGGLAIANENVLVVVANGGRDLDGISVPIPSNARVERFIPFNEIFPSVDVFVTNGGYGAVQQSLSMGVPIVVAGSTEDKPFVAARIAWAGAGINLGGDRPTAHQIRDAVRRVLQDHTYRNNARSLQAEFKRYDALHEITNVVRSLLAGEESQRTGVYAGGKC